MRLAHHQLPRTFDYQRHLAAAVSLLLLAATTVWYRRNANRDNSPKLDWLLRVAWIAVGFSIVGLAIDLSLTRIRPVLASQLLRFYWFRWSDIAVPLAWTLTFWVVAKNGWSRLVEPETPANGGTAKGNDTANGDTAVASRASARRKPAAGDTPFAVWRAATPAVLGIAMTLGCVASNTWMHFQIKHPAADDIMMRALGNREIETDRYVDWLAACEWIRANSSEDSLWFTPEFQQTFKWYAQRAEVVCWKDVPQDNDSVREWYQRVVDCRAPRSPAGIPKEWTSTDLLNLSKKYGFRWILVDRRIQVQPLLDFEIMYPVETSNRSFAVFRIPEGL